MHHVTLADLSRSLVLLFLDLFGASQKLRPSKCEAYGRNRVRRSASDIIHFVGFGHEKRYTVDPSWLIQLGG